jgi:hypothetical protein
MNYHTAAIIIDLWEDTEDLKLLAKAAGETPDTDPQNKLIKNIIRVIKNNTNIDLIILASYDIEIAEVASKNKFYKNTLKFLGKKLYISKIKQLVNNNNPQKTIEEILNWEIHKDKISFHYLWELDLFLKTNTIQNYMYFGSTFDECVLFRPLGYENLSKYIKEKSQSSNILLHEDCVLDSNDDFFINEKYKNWVNYTENGVFRYTK